MFLFVGYIVEQEKWDRKFGLIFKTQKAFIKLFKTLMDI